jgi:hypothetical protein
MQTPWAAHGHSQTDSAAQPLAASAVLGRHEAEYLRPDTAPMVAVDVVVGLKDATVPD